MNWPAGSMQSPSTMQNYLGDLAHLARAIPTATVQREIGVAEIAAARLSAVPRPSWLAVFSKTLGFVAEAHPELRQIYLPLPWPRLYQHPFAVAAVALERSLDDEVPALWARVRRPAQYGLPQLDSILKHFKEVPSEQVGQVRRIHSRSRWPMPLRRLAWGREAYLSGHRRARRLGTFAVASIGGLGAEFVDPLYPATAVLTFGTIQSGGVDLRLKFDARVLLPATAARILQDIERALRCELVMELRYYQRIEEAA